MHAQKINAKTVHHAIVGYVNEAMHTARYDKCPSQPELERSNVARNVEGWTDGKEQDGKLAKGYNAEIEPD